jgi:hypothetical protein
MGDLGRRYRWGPTIGGRENLRGEIMVLVDYKRRWQLYGTHRWS